MSWRSPSELCELVNLLATDLAAIDRGLSHKRQHRGGAHQPSSPLSRRSIREYIGQPCTTTQFSKTAVAAEDVYDRSSRAENGGVSEVPEVLPARNPMSPPWSA